MDDRKRWLKVYGGRYSRFGYRRDDEGNIAASQACAYCCSVAEDDDHVPALRWVYALGSGYFDSVGILLIKVPACRECNAELGDKKLFTLDERCRYLIGRYSKKYGRFLRNTVWEQEEIDELGRGLRPGVRAFAICQLGIDRRLRILEEKVRRPELQERISA